MYRNKSHADDLSMVQGTVRGRVALLLRSAEVYPMYLRFEKYVSGRPIIRPIWKKHPPEPFGTGGFFSL